MRRSFNWRYKTPGNILLFSLPLFLFWAVLFIKIPYSLSYYLGDYFFVSFITILLLYYLCYRLPGRYGIFTSLCVSMLLLALPLSYKWTSGYSDNMLIGGLLPYKDAKNYYYGANLIMNGLPVLQAGQATERPLVPGFLSSLLWLTDQNLKVALAILAQLAAAGLYLSARQIHDSLGSLSASIYATFSYFYIQPLVGYVLSEQLGFILGCFAFCLLWRASYTLRRLDLLLGLFTLLIGVSARAGAFFIFPALVLWMGWIFRGGKKFSIKMVVYASITLVIGYFLLNKIYAQLLGISPGFAFGNFSYALYGQVRGGTGWHSAIEELGTRNPTTVYRAALEFFLKHPMSLLIGFAKSYRDFFLPSGPGIFPFKAYGWSWLTDGGLWLSTIVLLFWGLIQTIKRIYTSNSAFVVAGYAGVFLSIPFLPPIDGGARFYASTMPFFFVLPAVGAACLSREPNRIGVSQNDKQLEFTFPRLGSMLLIVVTVIAPIIIWRFPRKPVYNTPSCPARQYPFVIATHRGSYIDLVKDRETVCGFIPEICLSDFEKNNTELASDDYYQTVMSLANRESNNIRIIPAIDLVKEEFHYFLIPWEKTPTATAVNLMSGCAVEIKTKNQSIYYAESTLPNQK